MSCLRIVFIPLTKSLHIETAKSLQPRYLQISQPKIVRVHSYKMMSKCTYIMVPAFTMSKWKIAGLNHRTCNVYYKMMHMQQTYMAFCRLQVWIISNLLNSKPFVNSSKTTITGRVYEPHRNLHLSMLNL
jgi:hypothetical protein